MERLRQCSYLDVCRLDIFGLRWIDRIPYLTLHYCLPYHTLPYLHYIIIIIIIIIIRGSCIFLFFIFYFLIL